MAYIEIEFDTSSQETREILIALLSAEGYEGFEESENLLKAFIDQDLFDETHVSELSNGFNVPFVSRPVAATNWNKAWESHFHPVIIEEFCAVRAEFHAPISHTRHELIITPKMSFGTGHHATTCMMILHMRDIRFSGMTTLDFGTGTGVLSILAEKLGARQILAIDNDTWSIDNAAENIVRNQCEKISLELVAQAPTGQRFDVILANVTRNVILEQLPAFRQSLLPGGVLVVSGFLYDDEPAMRQAFEKSGLTHNQTLRREDWISMRFKN